ncbi:hypothetical protein BURPS305_6069 [Burkholderia pseudomallei 305]|nr:hypothetical protein BURPS305_6069 [Burkholderia pseudomallei 305]
MRERADARAAGEAVSAHVRDGRVGARWGTAAGMPVAWRRRGWPRRVVAARGAPVPLALHRASSWFIAVHRGQCRFDPCRATMSFGVAGAFDASRPRRIRRDAGSGIAAP